MKYTNWKKIIKKKGLKKILKNPSKYIFFKPSFYTNDYLRKLTYELKKRYGKKTQKPRKKSS